MRLAVLCVLVTGCGRVAFDAITGDGGGGGDGDASTLQIPCSSATPIANNIIVTGYTFRYLDFNNTTSPLPFSGATAFKPDRTTVLANTITFTDGGYALSIPTNNAPVPVVLAYGLSGYWNTWVHTDRLLDADLTGPSMGRFRLGDGPLWDDGGMGSIYNTLGEAVNSSKAMLSVTVRDCAGGIIEGVTFDIDPPPLVSGYLDGSGMPGINTSTLAPYTQLLAFNVEPVRTRIRAMKTDLQFADFELDVQPGTNVNYVVVHPLDGPPPKP